MNQLLKVVSPSRLITGVNQKPVLLVANLSFNMPSFKSSLDLDGSGLRVDQDLKGIASRFDGPVTVEEVKLTFTRFKQVSPPYCKCTLRISARHGEAETGLPEPF